MKEILQDCKEHRHILKKVVTVMHVGVWSRWRTCIGRGAFCVGQHDHNVPVDTDGSERLGDPGSV